VEPFRKGDDYYDLAIKHWMTPSLRRKIQDITDRWVQGENEVVEVAEAPSEVQIPVDLQDTRLLVANTGNSQRGYQVQAVAATFLALLRDLGINKHADIRKILAQGLEKSYNGPSPEQDHETLVSVQMNGRAMAAVIESANRLGLTREAVDYEPPVSTSNGTGGGSRKKGQPKACACGCGSMTSGGTWMPGHDAKHKSVLLEKVKTQADTAAAAELVDRKWLEASDADARILAAQTRLNAAAVPEATTDT